LSRLAEVSLGAMFGLACEEVSRKYGIEGRLRGLAVIGAGKLGGRELTYGSDLDILFVYDEERAASPPGGLTPFELFSKVAEKTISYLTAITREGFAYRVDTRLRPTGSKGTLVQSIRGFRNYYSGQAETWERQALVNGRFVAGDAGVGKDFICTIEELIYRQADRTALAGAVLAMRKRMEEELGKEDASRYNIKQGYGGLVDIEFLAQYLQLVHGKERRWVRVPGAYNALRALRKEGLLALPEYRILVQAYLFIRMLESRMRIVTNQSTNDLSRDPKKLRPLARRLGYEDDALTAGEKLLRNYERVRKEVREAFERVVRG
ncbi:MAG TPA: bifunctional [glutamate--ammonia ligase]-adenylyl-L-tyrosine phosphorylase/[glutamate--ammonia-ligase] adenylyltransferase, partial [Nitrospirota bacterium]|nr:bifunctional [glutamate--ammonia ligase]-adenylyl-L-tyrosine phosphorylase/[glutamate--ammonia-ligase] adenylyltransferase [Nitrospirota bacterium]